MNMGMVKNKTNTPIISITIPTFNSEKTIHHCLSSITDQCFHSVEVTIVDNYSSDKTEEICRKYDCNFLKAVCGKAEARKIGFYHSKGDYILLLDSDMYLEKGLLNEIISLIENYSLDAVIISEEFPPKSILHVVRNIEKKCYIEESEIESPRFYRKTSLEHVDWDNLDDGWDEYEIFLSTKIAKQKIGTCQKKIYLLEKPINLGKKFHHGKYLKLYKQKYYEKEKVATKQYNLRYRFRLLSKAFKVSYSYGSLLFIIKFLEVLSLYLGSLSSVISKRNYKDKITISRKHDKDG
jgi:glycosyltransferase involved in cell wall biosynthesis